VTPDAPPSTVAVVADLLFASPDEHPLYADLYLPDAVPTRRPVIVWLHGGAWRVGDRRLCPDLSRYFAERGFAMVSVDYRLSQQSVFPAQIEDVKTVIRWVRHVADEYRLDCDRIGLWGSSAGAHLGALAAISRPGEFEDTCWLYPEHDSSVRCAVLGYPPIDFEQMDPSPTSPESQLIGAEVRTRPDLAAKANPISYMHDRVPPCLILHGQADEIIASRQSELLYEALVARGNRATLCLVDGLGHGFLNRTALDDDGPYRLCIRSSSTLTRAEPTIQNGYIFPMVEEFFRATL
jgi:acetyl esterase/lipase